MKNLKRSVYATFLAIIILILVGYTYDNFNSSNPAEYVVSTIESFDNSSKGVFRKAWRIIKNNYVDETYNHQDWSRWKERYVSQIEDSADMHVAMDSMLESLNDPYTRFLSKNNFEEQGRNIDAKLQGIGVHITEIDGNIIIISVIDDTPAKKYGLKKKDKIIKVDSVSTKGFSLREVADMVRGEKGSTVKLTVLRDGKPLTKSIVREEIKIKTVKHRMLDNNLVYIRITSFISYDTTNEFRKALFANRKADGIIVDVRGNYGGLLTNAVYISNMFIKEGNIVSIVDRNKEKLDYTADSRDFVTQKPLVILIDESSASASEIFSGAIKDHKRGILVGETTFGKGLVQMITKLPDGSGINFTIAKYLTPSGEDINKKGVTPDYEVDYDDNNFSEEGDAQFDKAIEILLDEIKGKQ